MNKSRHLLCAFGWTLLLTARSPVVRAEPPRCTIVDLGAPAGYQTSRATALNDRGQVVGSSTGAADGISTTHAFLWENGVMRDLGVLATQAGDMGTIAHAINNSGDIVGDVWPRTTLPASAASGYVAFSILFQNVGWRWHHGAMQIIGSPALALNDQGTALLGDFRHSQIWQGGRVRDVPSVPGFRFVTAAAINSFGDIAGCCANGSGDDHGFVRLRGKVYLLGVTAGQNTSHAVAVNDAGQVIGISSNEFIRREGTTTESGTRSRHGFFWQNGRMTDLGGREVSGLGAQGQVVGRYSSADVPGREAAFLWQNGKFTDLDTLIDKNAGWQLENATAINTHGQIVGYGKHHGQQHAFLLTPTQSVP